VANGKTCPECGAQLPRGALGGLCPACLLKQGAQTDGPAFEAPSVEEVRRLFPQLEIVAFLGKGGMGAVYKTRQPALDRFVALKILPLQGPGGPTFAERFHREARALAKLNHPNIVAVHDFGQVDGFAFFVMELVDGLNLRELERAGQLSPREALKIVPQICEALQFAHDEGIVHRDIKPENILLDKKGRVKIADFGIAKIMGREAGAVTETKHVIGTPHYMAPEQVEKPESVDHRADIFSLGVVFYEMLTGELPLGKFAPPSRKVEVDVRLDDVVLRALEKEPERRYQQARQVKTDVETVAHLPVAPGRSGPREAFGYVALGLFLLGTLGTLLLLTMSRRDDMALLFGGAALLMALAFGCLSWRGKLGKSVAVATMVIFGLFAITLGILSEVIPIPFQSERRRAAIEEAARQEQALKDAQQFQGVDALPPVVVNTEPLSGSRDVNPGTREIRVRFSKGMMRGMWSWSTAWSNSTPSMIGGPRYEPDGRTCVALVNLQPGRTYAFWLNSDQFENFRDTAGRPAVPYLLIFETKQE